MECPKCVSVIGGFAHLKSPAHLCTKCGIVITDWQQSEITRLRAELDALKTRNTEAESLLLEVGFDWTSDIGRKVRDYFKNRDVSQWDKVFGALPDLPDCED